MSNEPTTSIRDALESAIEANEVPEVAAEAPAVAPQEQPTEAPAAEATGRVRDENGRFVGQKPAEVKPAEAPKEEAQPEQPGITPGPKPGPRAQEERAPASWSPETRQHWQALPAEVRQEVMRREREVQQTLQETAEARRAVEAFQRTVAPYEQFIRAENSTPLQAMVNMFDTGVKLRTGSAHEVAQLVAGVVQQYGIGRHGSDFIGILDNVLAGKMGGASEQAPAVPPALQQVLQQELAPMRQFMGQMQQMQMQRQQQIQAESLQNVEQFLAQAEFGNDVRQDMADIMEIAARRGRDMSLQDAYNQAVRMHPQIGKIIAQREQANTGAQRIAQRAKAAASSVSGSAPVGSPQQSQADIRSAIEAAIEANSR